MSFYCKVGSSDVHCVPTSRRTLLRFCSQPRVLLVSRGLMPDHLRVLKCFQKTRVWRGRKSDQDRIGLGWGALQGSPVSAYQLNGCVMLGFASVAQQTLIWHHAMGLPCCRSISQARLAAKGSIGTVQVVRTTHGKTEKLDASCPPKRQRPFDFPLPSPAPIRQVRILEHRHMHVFWARGIGTVRLSAGTEW